MAYQINLTGQEIDERLQNIGTAEDVAAADGTLYARISKNADDVDELRDTVGHIDSAQTATDKTVTQHTADISALQTALKTKANLANGKVSVTELPIVTSLKQDDYTTIPSAKLVDEALTAVGNTLEEKINNKVVGLLHWQGVKSTTSEIKSITSAKKGDVWHSNGDGSEWVCTQDITTANADAWIELGTPVNLSGYYTKTEVDKKVKPLADSIGTDNDAASANGSLYARIKKNQADIADTGSRQTNIEGVVSGARMGAYFSLRFLNLMVDRKFIADIDNIKVVLYRWSGKRYALFQMFTNDPTGVSQKLIGYEIILKQEKKDGANIRTPYIHYNDDATEETLVYALKNAFGGRISYRKNKKRRWRLQAFLNGKPITAPFDFRVSIDSSEGCLLTKGGMMRSVPSSESVVYDGFFDGSQWLRCKKGDLLNLSYSADAGILFPPTPGNIVGGDDNAKGCVVAVKNITQDASSVTVLWTVGDSLYEIGVEQPTESDKYVYVCTSPAKKLCDDIYDYASKMSSGTLRDLYISAGAVYNEATGYYELNGLTDITEEEMRKIYMLYITNSPNAEHIVSWLSFPNDFRTNIAPFVFYVSNIQNSISGNSVLEVLVLSVSGLYIQNLVATAHGSFPKLRRVVGDWVYAKNNPSNYNFDYGQPFQNCPLLEEIRMKGINKSHTFAVSPNLSKESVLYMITNANPPSGAAVGSITITLHPTAYARLKDDADIVAALEAKGGIVTLVSA